MSNKKDYPITIPKHSPEHQKHICLFRKVPLSEYEAIWEEVNLKLWKKSQEWPHPIPKHSPEHQIQVCRFLRIPRWNYDSWWGKENYSQYMRLNHSRMELRDGIRPQKLRKVTNEIEEFERNEEVLEAALRRHHPELFE